ncbi:hypothetical protein F511_34400 [Dorcoceras hygrometricum]|uniref:Uncharacterized protein n=1 Tax=Dorcoceras hygrometricum TaxID=472368 RepID=A0A2Z7C171_9LAMI|nr:hypothetical protein F511_34400 [Dorcoceras hygrometricum]
MMEPEEFQREFQRKDVKGTKVYFKVCGIDNIRPPRRRKGDRPAEAPLCPAWLPEEPAEANTNQGSPRQGKINEVKPQYEDHNKSINHIRKCNISIVQCMKWVPKSSVGKQNSTTTQLCNLINHHHLVIFRYDDSADHHKAVWYSGATTQLATTSKQRWTFQARRLSRPISTCKGIPLSIDQAQYACVNAQQTHAYSMHTSHSQTAMNTEADNSAVNTQ